MDRGFELQYEELEQLRGGTSDLEVSSASSEEASESSDTDSDDDDVWTKIEPDYESYRLYVDEDLFSNGGREELLQVVKNMRKEIGVLEKKSFMTHLYVWLERSSLLSNLKRAIQAGLPEGAEPIRSIELYNFVYHLLQISAYGHSVSEHYKLKCLAPAEITKERFSSFLTALSSGTRTQSKRSGPGEAGTSSGGSLHGSTAARVPYGTSRELKALSRAMHDLGLFASKIGFVPGKTILSMDDDVMRNFSQDINLGMGAKMDYSDKKGAGLKFDSTGSVVSGLVLSEYIQKHEDGKGEKAVLAAIKNNLDTIQEGGPRYDPDLRPILALDRFYQSEVIVDAVVKEGFHVIGTVERHFGFPFVFGNTRIKTQYSWGMLNVKQPARVVWAKRVVEGTDVTVYAAGIVDGVRNAILMQTTSPAFGPGTFAYNLFTRTSEAINKEVSFPSDTNAEEDVDDERNAELDEHAGERTRRRHQRGRARTATSEATLTIDDDHCLRPSFLTEITVENLAQTVAEDVAVAVNEAMSHEGNFFEYLSEASTETKSLLGTAISELFLRKSNLLTQAQTSKDWFYLRFGRLTSTTSHSVFRALASGYKLNSSDPQRYPLTRLQVDVQDDAMEVLGALGIDVEDANYSEAALSSKTKATLKRILSSLGYHARSSTSKSELIRRILAVETPNLFRACISSFLMKPLPDLEPLRIGKANEGVALKLLTEFVQANGVVADVLFFQELGLLHEINNRHHADSPDAVFFYVPLDDLGQRILGKVGAAVVEVKTKTSEKTLQQELKLKKAHGKVKTIALPGDREAFFRAVPDVKHRTQLLTHTTGEKLEVWYVVAQAVKDRGVSKIVRLVRILVDPDLYESYKRVVFMACKENLGWFYSNDFPQPDDAEFALIKAKWSTSKEHFLHHRAISMMIDSAAIDDGEPLPPARNIFPRIISFWNLAKAPTDKKSQVLKSIQPNMFHFGTMARAWIRVLLGGAVYNAVRTFRLELLESDVREGKIVSLRQFRNRGNALGSFGFTLKDKMNIDQWLLFENLQPTTPVATAAAGPAWRVKVYWKGTIELDLSQPEQRADLDKLNQLLAKAKRARKIKLYSEEPMLRALRSNNVNSKHVPEQFEPKAKYQKFSAKDGERMARRATKLKCVLCCMACEGKLDHDENKRKCSGFDTTYCCAQCGFVPLCVIGRAMWGGLPCFAVWHDRRINDLHSGNLELSPCRSNGRTKFGVPFPLAPPQATPSRITPSMVSGNNRVSAVKRSRTNPDRRNAQEENDGDTDSEAPNNDTKNLSNDFEAL